MMPNPSKSIFFLLFLLPTLSLSQNQTNSTCPLDFSVLDKFITAAKANPSWLPTDTPTICNYALQALHLVQAQFLKTHGLFFPPLSSSSSCWSNYQSLLASSSPSSFNLLSDCGFQPQWISQGCMNITTQADFEKVVPQAGILDMVRNCNQSFGNSAYSSQCTACTTSLNRVKAAYLPGPDHGNVTDCAHYPSIYVAGVIRRLGPADDDTALCLFQLRTASDGDDSGGGSTAWVYGAVVGGVVLLGLIGMGVWFWIRRRAMRKKKLTKMKARDTHSQALESISASTTLIKFSFEEIRAATKKFSRDNIIGKGGYGNVYKGRLRDGSEVALKRFKNCSAAGDESFAHEVEVIASVRHVNLMALRGYCTATTPMEGHQRIIVCDLMKNGSLHDHLFGSDGRKLSWPIRQKIAVGTARGLAYLHYGAQPAILHRDIKASNILLDEWFEPKMADFGLARFAPEGMTHVSTRVAGTLGYVAPEYALYGQLTERSDVFSFGVVMLELLSGKKAFLSSENGQNLLLTDWAWSLVRNGKALDVIEEGMEDVGPKEVMEKYVLLSVLASHPQLHARPTMDRIVKILETDTVSVPTIPDRPLPLVANLDEIERSVSSCGSGQLSSFSGYQTHAVGNESEILISQTESEILLDRTESEASTPE